ncbi:breast carcinoma-amplified sequence 3 homolog isoform X2 [Coccinella septempunctata]|uniref:breast carcinoma-amplified sequence 3 homolog isoform X2 n=1 Tax=Coccinella septempunctata TaxID=41139 RepID=UPI001D06E86E|nr:breast carcinoma-amplified sequence 3 homolog isoform X2 [Coccinella septempunctata]
MSSDTTKYQVPKTVKEDPHVVNPQVVTDPSLLDRAAGFISDVVPSSHTNVGDQIQWVRFEQAEFEELCYFPESEHLSPPIFLVVGYTKGAQVWCISATGEATEIMSWRHLNIKTLRILPSPYIVDENIVDLFMDKRPLIALCDNGTPAAMHSTLSFVSLKTGEQVYHIKFRNQVIDLHCNKTSVVVTFAEKITVLDSFSLKERCSVTTCYLSSGINCNPIALGARWLAFADKTLVPSRKSCGGCENEGVQSYKATVIQCAKTLTQGFKDLSESVANSFTGNSNFKPSVVGPGSPQSGGPNDCYDKGTVTILNLECHKLEGNEGAIPADAVVAHFMAHSDVIVQLEFDRSGMLLLTADCKGYDFHVFRIHPHPLGSQMGSVHHLYTLHRGDTEATIQSMSFSSDSRWVAVSSARGTTHVFPITPYGGNINYRTHTKKRVVNKLSRYHRSAGLSNEERPRSPILGTESLGAKVYPYANPRHPPFPNPTVINPLAQLRLSTASQTAGAGLPSRSTITRQRSSSSSDELVYTKVVTCFAASRAHSTMPMPTDENEHKFIEHLFQMNSNGILFQYDLEPIPVSNGAPDLVCDDTPIQLKATPRSQWVLQRRQNAEDVQLPLAEEYLRYFVPSDAFKRSFSSQNDSHWLSQVEILTHAGPHRRLWMGPQFVFKTYTTASRVPATLSNIQQIDIARSKPVNMPVTQNAVLIECGSANSRELSPPVNTYHAKTDALGGSEETRLQEDLADAMLESSDSREAGGHRVIVSMKSQATPVAKVVNPLGTVVTIHSDAETEQEEFEEPVIHENCDEALFRPILISKPVVHTDGKPHTNPIDTMLVRSLDGGTEVAVKLLNKSKNIPSKIPSTNKKPKHINEKTINSSTKQKTSNRNINANEKNEVKKDNEQISEKKEMVSTPFDISNRSDSISMDENKYSSIPPDDIDCGLVFDDNKDFKNDYDFPYFDNKNEDKEAKTDMFEDATDCYDDLYINMKKEIAEKNEENLTEDKITTAKPRKPKAKLGVRIPNKNFPIKNDEEVESVIPKRSWSSVAATKPKDKVVDISEKENCDLLDLSDEKGGESSRNNDIEAEFGSSESVDTTSKTSVNSDGVLELSGDIAFL